MENITNNFLLETSSKVQSKNQESNNQYLNNDKLLLK